MRILRKDDRVSHTRFGPGVVIKVDARYTVIEFDETTRIFTNPKDKRTEDYVTGRFG